MDESGYHYDADALRALDDPRSTVFLTGKAGAGKSTLIRHWRSLHPNRNILTLAPTGIAALNVQGVTMHRFMHAGPSITPAKAAAKGRELSGDRLYRALDAIVLDEVSMARAACGRRPPPTGTCGPRTAITSQETPIVRRTGCSASSNPTARTISYGSTAPSATLTHPDQVTALQMVAKQTLGHELPCFKLGSKTAPWYTRLLQAVGQA